MIKLTFLGDIMCKKELIEAFKVPEGYNFHAIFEKMEEYFRKSDIVIGNLETPISKNDGNFTSEKYSFSSPYEFAKQVYDSGIKYVSTANNHCLDRGIEGLKNTIECLDEIGIKHTGTFDKKTKTDSLVLNIKGIKLGILSYTYGTNAFSNNNYLKHNEKYHVNLFQNQELSNKLTRYCYYHHNIFAKSYNRIMSFLFRYNAHCPVYERKESNFICKIKIKKDIKKLKKKNVDLIIMLAHMGGQYNREATNNTKKLCNFLVRNGVNIVAGNHEHTVHGGEFDKISQNKLITYSLGNFDGIAGVYDEPFDKMSEYSIAWNVYISKQKGNVELKTTFSVLKTIEIGEKKIQTVPLYDLINNESDSEKKEQLVKDLKEITYRFSGVKYNNVQEEYKI